MVGDHGFHGRRAELAACLRAARSTSAGLVVLRGAAGTGRTALLHAVGHALHTDGVPAAFVSRADDLTRLRPHSAVLLVDDADALPVTALLASRRNGLVIAACRADADELPGAADHVVDLPPLPEADVIELLAGFGPLDEPVIDALRTALGPLFHNPGTLLATLNHLHDRLAPVADRLCLRAPDTPIALPPSHHLVTPLDDLAERLLTAVAVLGHVRVDGLAVLAAALGEDRTVCGRTADALVDAGILVTDTHGRLRCVCPALAAAMIDCAGPTTVHRLHEALAKHTTDPATRADHVAAASRDLPARLNLVPWLITLADQAHTHQPHRAARWYATALRHLPAEHPDHTRILTSLLELLINTGQYDLLSDVLADQAATPSPHLDIRADLEAAAMLTAFHTGHPVKLAHEPRPGGPLDLYAWWIGEHRTWLPLAPGGSLLTGPELRLIYQVLSVDPAVCFRGIRTIRNRAAEARIDELIEAGAAGDPTTVFEIILGPRYHPAATGPLATAHKVVRAYAEADWSGALPAARQLELLGPPDSPLHQLSRIYVCAIHAARREYKTASAWLAKVSHDIRFITARAIAECALLHYAGDDLGAVNLALRTYRLARRASARPCVERLLLLALQLALRCGDRPIAAALLEEIEQLHARDAWLCTKQVELLGRALMHGDLAAAAEGADIARQRGHRPDLLWACHILARFCADPQPVIRELNDIAASGGSAFLLPTQLTALMRKFGVTAPHTEPDGLTATELRLIDLIRAGHTNRQIAATLHLSVKTIENHLTRLFTRTGCRSRVELAAASIDGRLQGAAT